MGPTAPGDPALGNDGGGVAIIRASGNTIGGAAAGAGNVIAGSSNTDGLFVSGSNNIIQGNYIGTNAAGSAGIGNLVGVGISGNNNTIGGLANGAGNVIALNISDGVDIQGFGGNNASGNLFEGNYVGTNAAGAKLDNGGDGVYLSAASGNTIGGVSGGNFISANNHDGVGIDTLFGPATNNLVQGNFIGTNPAASTASLGNANDGVFIGASGNTIGGSVAGDGNVISGNANNGVEINGTSVSMATNNVVAGNLIGTDKTGTIPVDNVNNGVLLEVYASDNTIGGTTAAAPSTIAPGVGSVPGLSTAFAGNLISGNWGEGLTLDGSSANLIEGNFIGVTLNGNSELANITGSAEVEAFAGASNNTIGGSAKGSGNVISGQNEGGNGLTINYTAANGAISGTPTIATGGGYPANSTFELYVMGTGIGGIIQVSTNGSGVVTTIDSVVAAGSGYDSGGSGPVVAAATSSNVGNDGVELTDPGTSNNLIQGNYIGTNASGAAMLPNYRGVYITNDATDNLIGNDGTGANDAAETNVVSGNRGSGIRIESDDNHVAGNFIGLNAAGAAAIPNTWGGVGTAGVYLTSTATGSIVGTDGSNSPFNVDERNYIAGDGTGITLSGADVVSGNWIGLGPAGTAIGSQTIGIQVNGSGGRVGTDGSATDERNVISGNITGIWLENSSATNVTIAGNYIGTDATGTLALGNNVGILADVGSSNNTIGGATAAFRNVISGNLSNGVVIDSASSNVIEGNVIGTDYTGTANLGNGGDGVLITSGATLNTIEDNVIDFNLSFGVEISGAASTGNFIHGNSIFNNGSSGIASTGGAGAVETLAVPAIVAISTSPTSTSILGSLTNAPDSTFVIDFFSNDSGNDGEFYLGSDTVETDGSGIASFNSSFPVGSTTSQVFTTTVTAYGVSGTQPVNTSVFVVASAVTAKLYVTNAGGNTIGAYSAGTGATINASLISGLNTPVGVAVGASGILYVSNFNGASSTIGEYNANTGATINASFISLAHGAQGLAINGSVLYVDKFSAGTIGAYNAVTGATINASLISGLSNPTALALDSSGNLYVTEQGTSVIGKFNAATGAAINASFISGLNDPTGLALDGSGNLYVANQLGGTIGEYNDVTGATINASLISGLAHSNSGPFGLTLDGSGNLYVVDNFTNTIGKYNASTGATINASLVSGLAGPSMIAFLAAPVTPVAHTVPAVSIGGPPAVVVGLPAGFTSTVTDSNPGQPKLTYTWTVTGPGAPSHTGTGFTLPTGAVTNEPAFTFTPTMIGKYTVQLTVNDGISVVGSNAITLTAGPLGQGVVIDGLTQAIVQPGATVPLTGKLLATDGATAAAYFWAVTQNGSTIDTGTASSFTFQPTTQNIGLAQISLTVVDSVGAVSSSSVFVTVAASPSTLTPSYPTPSVPVPPGTVTITTVTPTTASSTGLTTVFQGTPVAFSAQVSNLAVTGALTYRWTLSGPTGFSQKTGTGPTFGFTPTIAGSYSARVVVADNYSGSSQASTMLMVNATQPSVAIISAAGTVYNTATFTQNLTASVTDPGSNGTYAYKWYLNQALSAQTGANFTFSDNTSNLGNDSVKVVVTDNFGNTATTTTSFQVAMTNMTLTPQGPSGQQVLAVAAASGITIDASSLPSNVSVDEVALGSNVTLIGGSGPSILQGDSGFNSLVGGSGPDTLIATSGDTLVASSAMSNLFQINPGAGELATAMPGSKNNTLSFASSTTGVNVNVSNDTAAFPGSPNDSLILSGSFQAIVAGGGNNNLAAGRASKVLLFGGTGNDTLSASGGSSISLIAGSGNDSLSASGGTYISMLGGSGNDTMTTSGGSSITMFGGTGNDTISASGGSSITLVAGTGNDSLSSSGGTYISMLGGSGNDTMATSGGSSITMFGGAGHDALLTAKNDSSVTLVAGMGNETLSSINGTGVLLQAGTSLSGTSGNDHLISKGGKSITMFGGTGNDSVSASGGSSITLVAGSGNDSLSSSGGTYISMLGGAGNDTMTSSGGSSITMFGGTGNDSISSSGGSSITLVAGTGNDTLSSSGGTYISMLGGSGNDTMTTTGGSSITMFGGTRNDTLSAKGGSDITLVGTTGNDKISSIDGTNILLQGATVPGINGNDSLTEKGGKSITLFGGTGNDTLSASGGSSITLYGGTGNDTLSSSGGTNISMLGGTGNDTLTSTGGSSITMFGGTGNDSISSSGGSSITLVGGTGNDTLTAGLGNDSLTATGGSSISMFGGTGNDSLSASGGSSITLYGGSGNDTLSASGGTGISMLGGSGNDTLSSTGGSSITMFGGTGNDHLSNKGGHSITVVGGTGDDTLSSVNGTGVLLQGGTVLLVNGVTVLGAGGNDSLIEKNGKSITLFGGTGNDSLMASGGSSISLIGGTGNDSLSASGGSGVSMLGGAGNDTLTSSGGSSITMFGGAGNDTINATGGNGVSIYGQQGNNIYNISGSLSDPIVVSINTLATFGQNVAQDDSQTTGVNTIEFPGVASGIHLDLSNASTGTAITPGEEQAVAPGITLSLTGTLQDVVGTSGADSITAGAGNTTINGGGGNDTLIGGSGDTTLLAGTGNDSLVAGTGNTSFVFNAGSAGADTIDPPAATGVNTLDFSQFGGAVRLDMASTNLQALGNGLSLTLENPGGLNALIDSASGNDTIIGNNAGDSFYLGAGNDSITGGGGADSFYFSGGQLGSDTINETSTGNTLNFYGFGGPINLNLNQTGTQILDQSAASKLTLTLPNPAAFNSVVGTPYADAIVGNTGSGAATIIGGGGKDSLVAGNGTDLVQGYITQVVYLDFPSPTQTLPGDHTYTPLEEAAIQQGLVSDFSAFNYFFTQVQTTAEQAAQTTGGQYATIEFDAPVVGGAANQLDPDNLSIGGVAQVNVTPFLGNESDGLVPPTSANIIGMTTTIAAHELGHLSGLQHQDALGPIGAGIFSGIDPTSFYPAYSAYATTTSVSSSAASGGGVTFTAAVAADDSNSGTPTGFVNFYDTTTNTDLMIETVARVSLTSNVATIATPTATSYAVGELVTVSGLSSAHSFFDGTYQITAVGSNSFSYALVHADVATIADSGTTDILGVPLVGGSASYAAQVAAGDVVNAVFVSYAGFAGSSSSQTISPTGTATTLTSSVSADGLSVVLAATVTRASGATIAGTVDFLDTTTNTDLTPGGIALVNGVATGSALSATALAGQNIMAVYSGTANLAGSSATQTVGANAIETPFDVMASPDSVGSTLLDAAGANGPTYLGERDDVALAFNDTGAVQQKQNLPTETVAVSGVLPLTAQVLGEGADFAFNKEYVLGASGNVPSLAVPNTLPAGVPGAGTTFAVTATAVNATLAPGGADFYAFNGTASEVMTFQVISNTNTQNAQPIIPELLVVGPGGQVVGYNVHEFESPDSTLLDVTLPANGQYYVGVDSLLNLSPNGGNYELFMYSFATSVSGATPSAGGDSLVGGTGNDTLMGSSGNDLFTVDSLSPKITTIIGGSGQYTIINNGNYAIYNPTQSSTALILSASTLSVRQGQLMALTASITATSGGVPTGSVTFFDKTTQTVLGTVPLSVVGGVDEAVLPVTLLQVGSHTITSTYSSDGVFGFSYSQLTENVTILAPVVSVTDNGGPYNHMAYAATATVNGGSSLEGVGLTVTYYAGSTATGTPLGGAPSAAGTYTVLASFAGSADYSSASQSTTFTIGAEPLTITATSQNHGYGFGGASAALGTTAFSITSGTLYGSDSVTGVTISTNDTTSSSSNYKAGTYNLTPSAAAGSGLSNYSITYATDTNGLTVAQQALTVTGLIAQNKVYDGTTSDMLTGTASLSGLIGGDIVTLGGNAVAAFANANVGAAKPVTISGDTVSGADSSNYSFTQESGQTANITAASPAFSGLTASQSIVYGVASITVSGSLKAGALAPPGSVTITVGTASTSATIGANGAFSASLATSALPASTTPYTITYSYHDSADSNFSNATDASTALTVNKDATITAETATVTGQIVKLSATAAAKSPGSGTPTGSVDFFDTTTNYDLGSVALSSGSASLTVSLAPGSQTITATYSGDSNFLSGSGTTSVAPAASIYVLNSTASGALTISGSAAINVPGVVDVDSNSSSALVANGNVVVTAASIQVVGNYTASGKAKFTPIPTTGAASVADPFASLAFPSVSGSSNGAVNLSGSASQTINPGIYSSISVSGNATLTMNAGTYVIEGGGLTISGNANVKGTGTGVLIYNAGTNYPSAGGTFGAINIGGNGTMSLSGPTTGPDAGFVIFQSRDNTQAMTLSGSEVAGLNGSIYAPAAALTLSGNATLKEALVVKTMTVSGNAIFNNVTLSDAGGTAYGPAQIRTGYGVNSLSLDGTGQTIAIVDAYDNADIYQSLDQFDTQFGTTTTGSTLYNQYGPASSFLTVLNQNGQPTGLPSIDPNGAGFANWEAEEAMDVEWAHAVAPGSRIILVEANSQSLADLMSGVKTAAMQPGVSVVTMSWGFTEGQDVFASDEANYDSYMTAPGVTFVASTGDYGAADPEYPAFSPNVVAVGGTSLTLNASGSYISETGWGSGNNSSGTFFASGGGISQFEPEPGYQLGVQSTGARTTPDVSLIADPSTGAWIADTYNLTGSDPFEVVGGTSLSAPSWAGLIALADQGRAVAGQAALNATSSNQTQQALYSLPATDYNAITVGNNGYSAGPGYNLVTGLGTPVANLLVADLTAWNGASTRQVVTVAPMQSVTPVNTGGSSPSSGPAAFQVFAFELGGVAGQGRPIGGNSGEGSSAILDETSLPAMGMEETATFSSAGVNGKSIAKGENQIEFDGFAAPAIASGAAFTGSDGETPYRLYGDTGSIVQQPGNRSNSMDFLAAFNSRSTSTNLLDFLDYDGNGWINIVERNAFLGDAYSLNDRN